MSVMIMSRVAARAYYIASLDVLTVMCSMQLFILFILVEGKTHLQKIAVEMRNEKHSYNT